MKLISLNYSCSKTEAQAFIKNIIGCEKRCKKDKNTIRWYSCYTNGSREPICEWTDTGARVGLIKIFEKYVPKDGITFIKTEF